MAIKLAKWEKEILDKYSYVFEDGGDINDFLKVVYTECEYTNEPRVENLLEFFDEDHNLRPYDEVNDEAMEISGGFDTMFYTHKTIVNNPHLTQSITLEGEKLEEVYFHNVKSIQPGAGYICGDTPNIKFIALPKLASIKDEGFAFFYEPGDKKHPQFQNIEIKKCCVDKYFKQYEKIGKSIPGGIDWYRSKIKGV